MNRLCVLPLNSCRKVLNKKAQEETNLDGRRMKKKIRYANWKLAHLGEPEKCSNGKEQGNGSCRVKNLILR